MKKKQNRKEKTTRTLSRLLLTAALSFVAVLLGIAAFTAFSVIRGQGSVLLPPVEEQGKATEVATVTEVGTATEASAEPTEDEVTTTEEEPPAPMPETMHLDQVPMIMQGSRYGAACESISAVMALQYAGLDITVDDFLKNYLPRANFGMEGGKLMGCHPDHFFMGDPYSATYGYGCFAPCIASAILKFLPDAYELKNTTGLTLPELCRLYVSQGTPVMVWATDHMIEPFQGTVWTLYETGETYTWVAGEHCLVLTGYDENYYYFNDPMSGKVKYSRSLVETRYEQLGRQSLVVYASY